MISPRAPMAQLVEYRSTTQGLKITEEKVLPLSLDLQMVRLSSLFG